MPPFDARPAGLLRAGGLRAVQRADPGSRLPRGRAAVAAARRCPAIRWAASAPTSRCRGAARGSALECGRPRQRKSHSAGPVAPARWRIAPIPAQDVQLVPVSIFVGRAPDRGSRLVLGAVLGELGAGRPLPPPAGDPAQRPRHRGAVLAEPVARARHPRRGPAARAHGAQDCRACCARTSAASAPRSSAPTCPPGACWSTACSTPSRCARRSPTRPRRDEQRIPGGLEEGARASPGKSPPTIRNPVVRSLSFLLTGFWNRIYDGVADAPPRQAQAGRARA